MGKSKSVINILLITLSVVLLSCSESSGLFAPQSPESKAAAPDASWSFPLPDARETNGLTETLVMGKFTLQRSAGAVDSGTALVLDATGGACEWAVYGFTPGTGTLDSLALQLDAAPGNHVWVGLSDYVNGQWEWHGPFSSGKVLAIDSSQYLSPGGLFAAAVIADMGNNATVSALSIRTINPQNQSPTASFTEDVQSGNAPLSVHFDASGSSDSDGQIVEYAWDWDGDGLYDGFSDAPTANHLFSEAGLYTVHLRVTDDQFAHGTAQVDINVNVVGNNPPAADLQPPTATGNTPLIVSFDASASNAGGDPGDSIVLYEWDFDGDGNYDGYGSDPTISHTYAAAGSFTAKLRVTDTKGAQATDISAITVNVPGNAPPAAVLLPVSGTGDIPYTVNFDASGSSDSDGSIVLYEWDFDGDGNYDGYGTVATIAHTYTQPGLFTAKLRVTDNVGAQATDTSAITVNVPGNTAPTAVLLPGASSGASPLTVNFNASGSSDPDGTIVLYEWDFDGDGNYDGYGTVATIAHTYTHPGSFTAKLRVTDNVGAQATDINSVLVYGPGDWWMYGRDRRHTRLSPITGPATNALKWSFTTSGIVRSSPAIGADGIVYMGCDDNNLYAVNPDGTLAWTYTAAGTVESSPAIGADGTLYVGCTDWNLYAINPDGSLKWAYLTGGSITSSPAIGVDGTVYVGSNDFSLYAVNPDGTLKWSYLTGGAINSSPAIAIDGTVYVGCDDNNLYAIRPDGSFKWTYMTGGAIESSPAITAEGKILVGCMDNSLYCINALGGFEWSYATGAPISASVAISPEENIYVGSWDASVYALDPDGNLLWTYPTGSSIDSSPAVGANGTIFVGSEDMNLYALNPDGTLLWSYATAGAVWPSPAIAADGTVYVGSDDFNLYAIGPGV